MSKQLKRRANRDQLPSQMLEELEGEVGKMMGTLLRLKSRVSKDDLTGLLQRNEFFRRVENMVRQRAGDVSLLGLGKGVFDLLLILDVDDFKRINDLEGHVVGDHVLQRVGQVIQRCQKAGAEVGRFGGEEFVVALAVSQERTGILAEALRRQIQREVNVTVSVGVATARTADWEVRKMVGKADKALYEAKHAGKNRVCLAA